MTKEEAQHTCGLYTERAALHRCGCSFHTCVSEFAFEATSSIWLRSRLLFCNSAMMTSQLLDLPNKPFAITTRCVWLLVSEPWLVSGSSCMTQAILGKPVRPLRLDCCSGEATGDLRELRGRFRLQVDETRIVKRG